MTLGRDLGLTETSFETVLDPTGLDPTGLDPTRDDGDLSEDTALWMGASGEDGQLMLRLRYRTEVFDGRLRG
jgi:hypothetical protein